MRNDSRVWVFGGLAVVVVVAIVVALVAGGGDDDGGGESTAAQAVQHIGKVLVLYRQKAPPEPGAQPGPRLGRRAKSSGWDEGKEARDKPARRRKSARAQPPQRRRPRA